MSAVVLIQARCPWLPLVCDRRLRPANVTPLYIKGDVTGGALELMETWWVVEILQGGKVIDPEAPQD